MDITSLQNPRVKQVVRLREKRQRERDGLMLVEGWDELTLALGAGWQPHTVFHAPELATRAIDGIQTEVLTVSRPVFEKMSYRDTPDGWLAVFPLPAPRLQDLRLSPVPLLIVAESVEKPGNLGAMLRTADAAGADALIVCDPRTDIYNPNVVRASRGALFSVPAVQTSNAAALDFLRRQGITILAATAHTDVRYTDANLRQPIAIVVGTEDEGLSDFWLTHADLKVKIPMVGRVESLNVSVAAALIAYEAVRQRAIP
ncbi:MAG: RNA methyltransferase [Anaerolineales bacterium]